MSDIHLFLPELDNPEVTLPKKAGQWDEREWGELYNVAFSLKSQLGENPERVSSIPTMWARPLLMEMALYDDRHPLRDDMIAQWEGMLAAIALKEVRDFPLRVELVELRQEKERHRWALSLFNLLPSDANSLYELEGKSPWEDIYIFLWREEPVGMTSPSTLVCPSKTGKWTGLNWFSEDKLHSPHPSQLTIDEREQLWCWLDNLEQKLHEYGEKPHATNNISGLLHAFKNRLQVVSPQSIAPQLNSKDGKSFRQKIDRGTLRALNQTIKLMNKSSSVRLIPSVGKKSEPKLLIVPDSQAITEQWGVPPHTIRIYDGILLPSLNQDELDNLSRRWQVRHLKEQDLFLPDFFFITKEKAFPGGLLPQGGNSLTYKDQKITPIIPLNPLLLEYLTPEDLQERIKFEQDKDNNHLAISLKLPLSGVGQGSSFQDYEIRKTYELKELNKFSAIPILELWPNFTTDDWREYYALFNDLDQEDKTFLVDFHDEEEIIDFSEEEKTGNYKLARFSRFPEYFICRRSTGIDIGLILLKQPINLTNGSQNSWTVGFDFGSSFTNAFLYEQTGISTGTVNRLDWKDMNVKVTESFAGQRSYALYEFFIPAGAGAIVFPVTTVLTTNSSQKNDNDRTQLILDGRLYIPKDGKLYSPKERWYKTNLKWSVTFPNLITLFLKHLALQITAQAVKSGVSQIDWNLSYPLAFSIEDRSNYANRWKALTEELERQTGVTQKCITGNHLDYRSESLAVAQYFADYEKKSMLNSICIDIGGGSSDISIWENFNLVHQCSVRIAGHQLFAQFLNQRRDLLTVLFDELDTSAWSGLEDDSAFYSKLDVLLRQKDEKDKKWLATKKEEQTTTENPEFRKLIQLTTIGLAGLYYYAGILLKVLHRNDKYLNPRLPSVYLGGNGSRLLHWLDSSGPYTETSVVNDLLSYMLREGSGFSEGKGITTLSKNPKDEAALGLVQVQTELRELTKSKEPYIAGEKCSINGEQINWDGYFPIDIKITDFDVPTLVKLPEFLQSFHQALRHQEVSNILPVEDYVMSSDPQDNSLWENTRLEMLEELYRMTRRLTLKAEATRFEPPFILGLRALLRVLSRSKV